MPTMAIEYSRRDHHASLIGNQIGIMYRLLPLDILDRQRRVEHEDDFVQFPESGDHLLDDLHRISLCHLLIVVTLDVAGDLRKLPMRRAVHLRCVSDSRNREIVRCAWDLSL